MASAGHALRGLSKRSLGCTHVCRLCREQSFQPIYTTSRQHRFASQSNLPFTEKVRRKIWGTDDPPGLADPYGGPSFLEKRKMRREAERRGEEYIEQPQLRQTQLPLVQEDYIQPDDYAHEMGVRQASATNDLHPSSDEGLAHTSDMVQEDVPSAVMEPYIPAETIDGMKEVGRSGHWSDARKTLKDKYQPWLNNVSRPARTRSELLACLHRAIVESNSVLGIRPSPLQSRSAAEGIPTNSYQQLDAVGTDDASSTETVQIAKHSSPEGASSFQPMNDESFLSAELDLCASSTLKILKRFSQLSGHRISDPILHAAGTDGQSILLLNLLANLSKAIDQSQRKTVSQNLLAGETLAGLGNVMVMSRRESPVDKEKDLGRWKIIERELRARGLPVLGKLAD